MNDIVIRAEGLGKKYVIGHQSAERERYTALRDVLARQMRGLGRSAMGIIRGQPNIAGDEIEEFWALKDISFEVRRGDVVGVIGRNGAGKSTLLKILSRITEPSEGRVTIEGRVASLLEVGTGFHPELTGRENIYLNGAILGMTRAEIKRKFDEIVDFAGVGKFLDTPVKRYSSGMYVRLAFAVAAHLEPEILVVDEVLAVGDVEFQKKCLGKMRDVANEGRTVLFVSHNMGAVERLTQTAIFLRNGKIAFSGLSGETVNRYLSTAGAKATGWQDITNVYRQYGNGKMLAQRARVTHHHHPDSKETELVIEVIAKARELVERVRLSFTIFRPDGMPVGSGFSRTILIRAEPKKSVQLKTRICNPALAPGAYTVGFAIGEGDASVGHVDYDVILDSLSFEVHMAYDGKNAIEEWHRGWGDIIYQTTELETR